MPLHPIIADRLHLLDGLTSADTGAATPDSAIGRRLAAFYADEVWEVPDGVSVTDSTVDGPHGDVPVRRYEPARPSGTRVVWVHGGGFAAGTLDWPESHTVAAELAARTGATVIAVDYRLAGGDVRHPVPIDDVSAVLARVAADAAGDGGRASVVIGGASAGAALALAAALRTPSALDAVLLAYPFVHFPVPALDPATRVQMDDLPPLLRFTPESIEWMVQNYVGRLHDLPADALPGHAALSDALPPTSVLTSEYDDLRPSGELLVRQLAGAGVEVRSRMEPGVLHGHLNRLPSFSGVDESLSWFADGIRAVETRVAPAPE